MSFSDKRFTDIGQTLYIKWVDQLGSYHLLNSATEEQCREKFAKAAQVAFVAAEEFAKVFDNID